MLARIRQFLHSTPLISTVEHLAVAFAGAFLLTAVATAEHAASTRGLQLSWSFVAGAATAGVTGGYQAVRPQLLTLARRLLGKLRAATKPAAPAKKS